MSEITLIGTAKEAKGPHVTLHILCLCAPHASTMFAPCLLSILECTATVKLLNRAYLLIDQQTRVLPVLQYLPR